MSHFSKYLPLSVTRLHQDRVFEIRGLRSEDAVQCADIHQQCFAYPWVANDFEYMLCEENILGHASLIRDKIIGFTVSRIIYDEAEILTLATRTVNRRRGAAKTMLAFHLSKMKDMGVRKVFLEVDGHNLAAHGLYFQFNFNEVGVRSAYYRQRDGSKREAKILSLHF